MISETARRRRKINKTEATYINAESSRRHPPTDVQTKRKKVLLHELELELGFYPVDLKGLTILALQDFLISLRRCRK